MKEEKMNYEDLEKELEDVFHEISNSPDKLIVNNINDKSKKMLSRNLVFLRHYLGFVQNFKPYNQTEFSEMLNVSLPTLKKWEGENNLPSRFSLKSILNLTNKILFGEEIIRFEHILCKNLVHYIVDVQIKEYISAITEDISKKNNNEKETEQIIEIFLEKNRKFEESILTTLNKINDACLIIQRSQIVFVNNAAIKLFSGTDQLMTNLTLSDIMLPEMESIVDDPKNGKGENISSLMFEKTLRKTNGRLFNAIVSKSYVIFNSQPAIQYIIKEKTEEHQDLSPELYKNIIDTIPNSFVIGFNSKSEIIFAKGKALGYLNLAGSKIDGKFIHSIFPKEISANIKELISEASIDGYADTIIKNKEKHLSFSIKLMLNEFNLFDGGVLVCQVMNIPNNDVKPTYKKHQYHNRQALAY